MKRIWMTVAAVALALGGVPGSALAQKRASTVDRPCAVSRQEVFSRGAAVLGTGGHTFDRFVRDARFCQPGDVLETVHVPARDTPYCFIGYRCKTGFEWD